MSTIIYLRYYTPLVVITHSKVKEYPAMIGVSQFEKGADVNEGVGTKFVGFKGLPKSGINIQGQGTRLGEE